MTIHFKENGAWVQKDALYIKRSNTWQQVQEAYVKRSGVWEQCYGLDNTPPPVPQITLDLTTPNSKGGRWLRVGINLPGSDSPECKLVRVLSTYNGGYPTTQYGGVFTATKDTDWPNEPWSEWYYNGYSDPRYRLSGRTGGVTGLNGGHPDTSSTSYKQWLPNYSDADRIPGDRYYYFTAWSQDFNGNWSAPSQARIYVPKTGTGGTNTLVKSARFQPKYSGTVTTGVGFAQGPLIQNGTPVQRGFWFLGNQLAAVGANGTPHIKSAQILVNRTNDSGQAVANVYLFRHNYSLPSDVPTDGTATIAEPTTLIGTINKGEAKWFTIPTDFIDNLQARTMKGFGLWYQHPPSGPPTGADYSVMAAVADDVRSGEVYLSWTESV